MFNISNDKQSYRFFNKLDNSNEIEKIPPGVYKLENIGLLMPDYVFTKASMNEKIIEPLSSKPYKEIKEAVMNFFNPKLKELYKELDYLNKKGILIYGNPGTGKTASVTNLIYNIAIKENAVVLQIKNKGELFNIKTFLKMLKDGNSDLCVILLIDECENYFEDYGTENFLLNFLDGYNSENNVLTIFITNKIEKIPERFKDRPSRIRNVIEYNSTPFEVLLEILTNKIPEKYHNDLDIKELAFKYSESGETIDKAKTKTIELLENLILSNNSKKAKALVSP